MNHIKRSRPKNKLLGRKLKKITFVYINFKDYSKYTVIIYALLTTAVKSAEYTTFHVVSRVLLQIKLQFCTANVNGVTRNNRYVWFNCIINLLRKLNQYCLQYHRPIQKLYFSNYVIHRAECVEALMLRFRSI